MRWKALGREPNADDVETVTWAVYQHGLKVSGVEYIEAIAAAHAAGRKIARFLTTYDVILSTTLAGPPPRLGYFDQNDDVQTFTERVTEYLSVTPLHNATGTPAMSVPLHWTADGRWACTLPAAMVRKLRSWRSRLSWRQRNRGSIACRHCELPVAATADLMAQTPPRRSYDVRDADPIATRWSAWRNARSNRHQDGQQAPEAG